MTFKDMLNPLFSCAARLCDKSEAARSVLRDFDFKGKGRIVARIMPEAIGPEVMATCRGIRYQLDLRDDIQRNLYFNCTDCDERELKCALDLVPVGGTCVDVGANIG